MNFAFLEALVGHFSATLSSSPAAHVLSTRCATARCILARAATRCGQGRTRGSAWTGLALGAQKRLARQLSASVPCLSVTSQCPRARVFQAQPTRPVGGTHTPVRVRPVGWVVQCHPGASSLQSSHSKPNVLSSLLFARMHARSSPHLTSPQSLAHTSSRGAQP